MKAKPQNQHLGEIQQSPHSPRANTLFHFCRDEKDGMNGIDKLKSILKNGFFPRYSRPDPEDVSAISKSTHRISFPFVSFCDIPIERLRQHTKFYGCCGIGMNKINWRLTKKLNPVIYIKDDTSLAESFKTAFKGAIDLNKIHDESECLESSMLKIAAYAKPLDGYVKTIDGKKQFKEFYQENEWRYVPSNKDIQPYILEQDYETDSERLNKIAEEKACLEFYPKDIRYIFLETDLDAVGLVDFIEDNICDILSDSRDTQYREYWKKMLFTKIVILEELFQDI